MRIEVSFACVRFASSSAFRAEYVCASDDLSGVLALTVVADVDSKAGAESRVPAI
eukprot:SAG31_NODE_10706_length_1108_cov_1.051536_2_plen_54_part_01